MVSDVYNQVSYLLTGNEDLLGEFCAFLPPDHTKSTKYRGEDGEGYPNTSAETGVSPIGGSPPERKDKKRRRIEKDDDTDSDKSREEIHGRKRPRGRPSRPKMMWNDEEIPEHPEDWVSPTRRSGRAQHLHPIIHGEEPEVVSRIIRSRLSFAEAELFLDIKFRLQPEKWGSFLKCMEMYNSEIVSKFELLALLRELIVPPNGSSGYIQTSEELFDKMRVLVGVPEGDFSYSELPLADLDLSHCERSGASYWRRPESYTLKPCSGRTPLDQSVLNDTWLSRPTGT